MAVNSFEHYHQYLFDFFTFARDSMLDAFYESHPKDVFEIKRIRLEVHKILNENGAESAFPDNLKYVENFLYNEIAKNHARFEEYPVLSNFLDNALFMTTGYKNATVKSRDEEIIDRLENIKPASGNLVDDEMQRLEAIVSRAIDRIATRVIEQSEDIGFLGRMASRIIALREDLSKIVVLSHGDTKLAKKYLDIYTQKHKERLGDFIVKELQQIAGRIDKMNRIEKDGDRDFSMEI